MTTSHIPRCHQRVLVPPLAYVVGGEVVLIAGASEACRNLHKLLSSDQDPALIFRNEALVPGRALRLMVMIEVVSIESTPVAKDTPANEVPIQFPRQALRQELPGNQEEKLAGGEAPADSGSPG